MTRDRVAHDTQLLIDFLNTNAMGRLPDRLDDPEVQLKIVFSFVPAFRGESVNRSTVRHLRRLRAALFAVINSRDTLAAHAAWNALNGLAAGVSYRYRFTKPSSVELAQIHGDRTIGAIVACAARAMRADSWDRVKVCARERCNAVFYDATRSRTRRWHSYARCGNAANVAACRRRQRSHR